MESSLRVANIRDYRREPSRSQVACSRCALGELCLPRGLTPDETERFEQIVHRSRPIQPGEHLFRAGDEFRSVASVRTGCFKSYVIDHEGQEQVLGFHLPGEIIGLDAIHSCKHVANVVALDTSAVCGLTFDTVTGMARHMPELQNELFRVMSQRISELETIAGDLSADERIAMFLLSLSERFARRGYSDKEFILAMSRRDIASYLRLATETVSRVLARFQKAGVVKVDRKQVQILDIQELKVIARKS
ncbi:MAG: fumarate/nitrate reduction transcriptional regulator Fnr [Xanthomonadales bacterium]|nr:fumarate/nitrate reduction transcriptional regulator Fnr [Gammaproteobacteria bacterium]MBT8051826.1 fumarate/nitrate reduction transcriptional regulator Fnr [Gammaproteobacteria bacterium]MBT8057811.1 fumarate/nitrate reduction transcriptional regulator Fnr [Gammaproteobacteria bacterium]NNJ77820.1 fumarate/nitrate reduction transcriptional regulator Fnr [Xanthomonadales bacterium]NNL04641.1 fumarate/nitrate reduction transcriptional regulator Fnr [Xanthomonadales bacterium]